MQGSIILSNANGFSQNQIGQNARLDRNDGLTTRSPEGILLINYENSRKQGIIDIGLISTSNSSNRCITPKEKNNTRTRFWRGSSSTRSMAKLPNTLDKQQERTAGHSFRNNSFRKSLQKAADNQSPNQIRKLYTSILFKETKSNRHFYTSSEGDLLHLPTFEYENNNITRIRKDNHNRRLYEQVMYI
ncbi:MAG: hypothetical protein EZS28_051218 [Streblomastix strix]|uniref:Uncharacterized protein n=1 Tax=Streblomastix strix TaxID=222440 RepID=A0A5J4T796_9EUKA|nr:MAG: hypothetical protein EZS28_051218 [Streblomastix strix]